MRMLTYQCTLCARGRPARPHLRPCAFKQTGYGVTLMHVQVNDALSDRPAEKMEYSMRQEQEQVLRVGARIMACLARRAPLHHRPCALRRSGPAQAALRLCQRRHEIHGLP